MREEERIEIPPITLRWSPWVPWHALREDVRAGGANVPDTSGVYEAKHVDAEDRLTIGKASNLRMRVKQGLIKGNSPHSAGERIRAREDIAKVVVRWAETDRPSAVEEELHERHRRAFGQLPKYVDHT